MGRERARKHPALTPDSPLAGPASTPIEPWLDAARRYAPVMVTDMRTDGRAERLVKLVWRQASNVGIDPAVVLGQTWLETGYWSSWWYGAPRRNAAGIGVNGASSPSEVLGWQRKGRVWLKGKAYRSREAAHGDQVQALAYWAGIRGPQIAALRARLDDLDTLPHRPPAPAFSSVTKIVQLGFAHNHAAGTGWAFPGTDYGAKIARVVNTVTAT
jgi:hypothetical protein